MNITTIYREDHVLTCKFASFLSNEILRILEYREERSPASSCNSTPLPFSCSSILALLCYVEPPSTIIDHLQHIRHRKYRAMLSIRISISVGFQYLYICVTYFDIPSSFVKLCSSRFPVFAVFIVGGHVYNANDILLETCMPAEEPLAFVFVSFTFRTPSLRTWSPMRSRILLVPDELHLRRLGH